MKPFSLLLVFVFVFLPLSALFAGCGGGTTDGDVSVDGDTAIDGDTATDGDTGTDGDNAIDGDNEIDGDTSPDGDTQLDGDTCNEMYVDFPCDQMPGSEWRPDGIWCVDGQVVSFETGCFDGEPCQGPGSCCFGCGCDRTVVATCRLPGECVETGDGAGAQCVEPDGDGIDGDGEEEPACRQAFEPCVEPSLCCPGLECKAVGVVTERCWPIGIDGDQDGDGDVTDGDTALDGEAQPDGDPAPEGDTGDGDTASEGDMQHDGETATDGDATPDGDISATFSCSGGICLDPATGFEWQQTPTGGTMDWDAAIVHCQNLDLQGTGWRLPNISELRSLVRNCEPIQTGGVCGVQDVCGSCGVGTACLASACWTGSNCDPPPCDDDCNPPSCANNGGPTGCYWPSELAGACDWYWSSSRDASSRLNAWGIFFDNGHVYNVITGFTNGNVRCVR